jgi:formylglycine-generating enzyme
VITTPAKCTVIRAVVPVVALAVAAFSTTTLGAVTIDWVTVGNPGNANDTTGFGAVAYDYRIGTYEVTIGQYAEFLNAVAATDTYGLYNPSMAADQNVAGIAQSGASGSFTYAVTGPFGSTPAGASSPGNRPITFVSWFDAARFANWMQNGQGAGSTETGAYALNGATSGTAPAKSPGAEYWIPTENEWYKAAFFSPALNSGAGGYYSYATQSNVAPGNLIGGGANQANYLTVAGWSVTQSSTQSSSQNYLTDVGAFSNSPSYYGTFDQSGNVFEWNDRTGAADTVRGLRGGFWNSTNAIFLSSAFPQSSAASSADNRAGFRLASPVPVPEPATYAMTVAGLACVGYLVLRSRP